MDKVHYSSKKMDWGTPQDLFDKLDAEFNFTCDVAASADNAKCEKYFDEAADGLAQKWEGVCWMNPPYGREIVRWIMKANDEKANGVTTVCLVPARPDTAWWSIFWDHDHHCTYDREDEVRFVRGRIKFEGAEHSAPFPSAILVFRGHHTLRWCPQCATARYEDYKCGMGRVCGLLPENTVEGANKGA